MRTSATCPATTLRRPSSPHDFRLIDSTTLLLLRFGDDDLLLGADVVTDPAVVVRHCYHRDVARHYAVPGQKYARQDVRLSESP